MIVSPGYDRFRVVTATWEVFPVKSQIIGTCAMSLELPPLVRSRVFLFFYASH